MNNFSDFNIKNERKGFSGEKIDIERILNTPVIVEDYKIEPSKFAGKGMCLTLQIKHEERQRVVFTSSKNLQDLINKVDKTKFPFRTTIIKENKAFLFT